MKIEVTKEELRTLMDCVNTTDRAIRGENLLSFMSPSEIVRRFGKIALNAFWFKLRNLNN